MRLPDNKLQDIIKTLPASYHAIHALCSLSPEELFTASKSKILSPVMSVRQARAVVKKIKFPTKAILEGEQGQWGTKHTYLFNVVTGEHQNLPGEKVTEILGIARGSTVRARNIGRDLFAGLKNIIGGELSEYTKLQAESREQALQRMIQDGERLGADAIINIRISTSVITQGAAEILAYGTAVKIN